MSERHDAGMGVRRQMLSDAHVDRAEVKKTALDADFQAFITEGAWGSVWARPGFTLRERSIVTLKLLAALGATEELAKHVRATARAGATHEDLVEAMLHLAVYAGAPRANPALKPIEETCAEMEEKA